MKQITVILIFSVIVLGIIASTPSLAKTLSSSTKKGKSCPVEPDRAKQLQDNGYPTRTSKQIIEATKSQSYNIRNIALKLLVERTGEKAIPTLKKALDDPKGRVRWTAAHLLGTLGDKSCLKRMKQDLKELAPNNGAFLPAEPNLTEEAIKERETKWNYRLEDALEVAKVLAEIGDYSGYELATRMAIQGPLHGQRWRAVAVLVETAKADKVTLQSKGLDPVTILYQVAESEKEKGVIYILANQVQLNLSDDVTIQVLKIAKESVNLPEEVRNVMARMYLVKVKTINKKIESKKLIENHSIF